MAAAVPAPASVSDALGMLTCALRYLAAADATELPAQVQARSLQVLERADAIATAARASILAAFTAGQGYCADADYSPRMWLITKTRITKGAAAGHLGWARRAAAHPRIAAALAEAQAEADLSESFARTICQWTDKIPPQCRDDADEILIAAARAGLDLREIIALAAEIYARSRPDTPEDPEQGFKDRGVRLETTFQGAGVLGGDLSPECAALVGTVLDALSAPRGAEDTRTHEQRYHDALEDAMRRLVASGLLPERAGQPVRAWAHIPLADLLVLDADSVLLGEWTARVRAQWAGFRAAASVGGGDGAAWLEGDAAQGFACDASVTPVVTADVNLGALDDLVRLCVELAGHGPGRCGHASGDSQDQTSPGAHDADTAARQDGTSPGQDQAGPGQDETSPGQDETSRRGTGPVPPTGRGREALEQAIIGKAVELLSGPGGLASFLRRRQLGARLGGPSLPLDVGMSDTVPAGIRHAVRLRDQHCQWPGGCGQPAAACEVHHVTPRARGGKTSLKDCVLLCFYHHHVVIHRWGWTLLLNPDGTTTAWNPDRTKELRSNSPPARAG